jgi:hypothetical protein
MLPQKLTIPEPCTENWEGMHSTTKGKFCGMCQKDVIDFSVWTDEQIIQYFEHQQNKTCGRLTQRQIERINLLLQKQASQDTNLRKIFAWILSASTFANTTILQETKAQNTVYQEVASKLIAKTTFAITQNEFQNSWIVTGTVTSTEDGTPLPGVTVLIKNTNIGTQTDIDGAYKLSMEQFANQPETVLVFSFVGMETQEQKITPKYTTCNVVLKPNEVVLGEVVSTGIIVPRRNIFQRTWWKTKYFVRRLFGR